MINYHQLKQIHEWAQRLADKDQREVDVTVRFEIGKNPEISLHCYRGIYYGDEVISKLQELTEPEKPKPKYEIGQEVWCLNYGEVSSFLITDLTGDPIKLWSEGGCVYEEACYPTKEALINAQIDYWHKQNCEDGRHEFCEDATGYKSECLHCGVSEFAPDRLKFEGEIKGFNQSKDEPDKNPKWTIVEPESINLSQAEITSILKKDMQQRCAHEVNKETKSCRKCGLDSKSIPCVGGWI